MKVFLDSDVLLDFLIARELHLDETKIIIDMGLRKEIKLYTSSLIIANIHYYIGRAENTKVALDKIEKLTSFIKVLNVGEQEIQSAIRSKFKDFEDAIQNACAAASKIDVIVTRNIKDYKKSKLAILTPYELVAKLKTK